MTQPTEAVGGSDDIVIAAEPTLADRFSAAVDGDEQDQEVSAEGDAPAEQAEPEPTAQELADEPEADAPGEEDLPPIKPPVSLTAEEQEAFRSWPREAQEAFSRRVGELERGLHGKAQEARQARTQIESEAASAIRQLQGQFAAQLEALMPPIPPRPSHKLQAEDPWAYAEQMDAYEHSVAQHQWAQQQLRTIEHDRAASSQAERQQVFQQEQEALHQTLPEWFDETEGPKLRAQAKSIAHDLGYSAEQLPVPNIRA